LLTAETAETLAKAARAAGDWLREREPELRAFATWGAVVEACEQTGFYAPRDDRAWEQIAAAKRAADPQLADLVVSLYQPGGPAFGALEDELRCAEPLAARQGEVGELLASLADARHYLVICGTLPLIESALASGAGKWKQPSKQDLLRRLWVPLSELSEQEQDTLYLHAAAVKVVTRAIPELWKPRTVPLGSETHDLNRQLVLHGTARGWDTQANAMRAVLLLAATSRVAGPLLAG
jgi:hypothetical protein